MKVLLTILAVIIVVVGAIAVWGIALDTEENVTMQQPTTTTPTNNRTNSGTVANTAPAGFHWVSSTEAMVRLVVPNGATTSAPTENRYEVTFLGPNNEPATEIQDGFVLTIYHNQSVSNAQILSEYTQDVIDQIESQQLAVGSQRATITIAGTSAVRFMHETQLGNTTTRLALLPEPGRAYEISYSVHGTRTPVYQGMISTMLDSLKILSF